jgi:tetratricopeptide (TPR) repeat protein
VAGRRQFLNCPKQDMQRLAYFYEQFGQHDKAVAQWKESLALQREILGPHHEDILATLDRLVKISRHEEVIIEMEELLSLRKDIHGIDNDHTFHFMLALTSAYREVRQYDKAEALWKEMISLVKTGHKLNVRHVMETLVHISAGTGREVDVELLRSYAEREDVTVADYRELLAM